MLIIFPSTMQPPSPPTCVTSSGTEGVGVSKSYVLMVQHLIERCLILCMDREECVRAIAKRARVKPAITLTVWKELEAANPDFFSSYGIRQAERKFSHLMVDANTKSVTPRISGGTAFPKRMQKVLCHETRASHVRPQSTLAC